MSMIALALAAAVTQAPGDSFAVRQRDDVLTRPGDAACPPGMHRLEKTRYSRRQAAPGRSGLSHRLGDLPKANLSLTVLRSVDGCAVSSTVRYDVEGDGRAPR